MNQKLFFTNSKDTFWDYKANKLKEINSHNFPAAFFSVIGVMAEDCNYHIRKCYNDHGRLFFEGYYHNHYSELMLRYGQSKLVVARIEFAHKRSGNMTILFEVLKHIKRAYHLDKIVIESVQTDAMRCWCQKHNFIPCGDPDQQSVNWEWK